MSTSELENFLASCAEVLLLDPSEVSATSHGVDGDTPLHVAVWQSNIKAVSLLIEAGADVDAKGEMSETPLHVALSQRNILAVKILLSAGANPNLICEFGDTPRQRAETMHSEFQSAFY